MIEAEHLTKDYGTVVAVSDLSFRVDRGQIVGFLGPNGAGKTTTLRILAGFVGASSGQVRINGHDIVEESLLARRCVGYMPEATPLYPELRVREYLLFRAALKQVARRKRAASLRRVMQLVGLSHAADTLIGHLSKGYRQRVGLADALLADPPLLILDEPTIGLDPNQIRDTRRVIRELGADHTVLLSTHILSEAEAVCDRVLVIDRGRLVAEGSVDELRAMRACSAVVVVARDPQGQAKRVADQVPGVAQVSCAAALSDEPELVRLEVSFRDEAAPATEQTVAALVAAGVAVREVRPARATLEEVFAQLTGAPEPLALATTLPAAEPTPGPPAGEQER